jgi:hypothetical protein
MSHLLSDKEMARSDLARSELATARRRLAEPCRKLLDAWFSAHTLGRVTLSVFDVEVEDSSGAILGKDANVRGDLGALVDKCGASLGGRIVGLWTLEGGWHYFKVREDEDE